MGLAWMSLVLAALAGLPGSLPLPSTPPLPGWLQGAMGGPAVGEARRQPPAIIGSSIPGPLAGDWIQDPPGPWRILDEGWLLHHLRPSPPGPPGRRLTGNGDPLPETIKTPAYKQGRGRGRESGRGRGRGSGWGKAAQENIYKHILS